jgi:hypothetical protein
VQWILGLLSIKWSEHGVDHPPTSNAKVKEVVELYPIALCAFMAFQRQNFTYFDKDLTL